MKIIADTHVHFYPFYEPALALRCLTGHLAASASGAAVQLGFLAERSDCHMHAQWLRDGLDTNGAFRVEACADGQAVRVRGGAADGGEAAPAADLYLLPGRQVVTLERVEILALALADTVPDGLTAAATVERTLELGGVPVLAWAPGKWFFRRKQVVRDLLETFDREALLIGDSSLRPTLWAEPVLMRAARQRGVRVVAGSDPLPFRGEEREMGAYATLFEGGFDPNHALQSARALLRGGPQPVRTGRRGGVCKVLRRLWKNARG